MIVLSEFETNQGIKMISTENLTKQQKLDLIYKHTHPDFKGVAQFGNWGEHKGKKTILVCRYDKYCLSVLEQLTDEEIESLIPHSITKERNENKIECKFCNGTGHYYVGSLDEIIIDCHNCDGKGWTEQ